MSSGNSIKDTFFEECDELLEAMSDGLAEMEAGTDEEDTIHSVFRGVHSIKGGAGAFAMDEVVSFAHRFETVLDRIRSNQLTSDETLMGVLQRAGDHLAVLIEQARQGNEGSMPETETLLEALGVYLDEEDAGEGDEGGATFEAMALSFEPAPIIDLPLPQIEESAASAGFLIKFAPKSELYVNGHEPALMLQALSEMGEMSCKSNADDIPALDTMDWERPYLSWDITLETSEPEHTIQEVFEFVEGLCELSIQPLSNAKTTEPDESAPEPPAAQAPEPEPQPVATAPVAEPAPAAPAPIAAPTPQASKPTTQSPSAPRATLRVDLERVDRLINTVGELIINQAMIAQKIDEANLPSGSEVQAELEDYQTLAREIQEGVMSIRAQPVKPLFQRMSRIVREAMDATGKSVKLVTDGETTEVDKTVIERLADPLTHMIRNAVDHGIEQQEDRIAAGKDKTGSINLSASHRSGSVLIKISDDGAGLNRERILQTAVKKGLVSPTADLSESEIDNLLFMPGFSTASEISNLSGRGVGMDVVKTSINNLGGRVSISSQTGKGSVFSITLPLTLAVLDGMVVHVTDQVMIVPLSSILETVRPTDGDLHPFGINGWMLRIRDTHVPIFDVATLLGLRASPPDYTDQVLLLVESEDRGQFALAVDDISDQRQVVIKGMQANYGSIPGISAATILGDGKIALIVDPDTLTQVTPPDTQSDASNDDPQEMKYAANS